ncbi:MAG: 7-carboxy-7-deazaguanine synthase QueE [Dehalococcoidia bacterium]|nr:7-carboxy-7-deazaguanine synthase QueE [Dehalococcoidia bacterium]
MLKVAKQPDGHPEIFYSVQGEGINAGKPSVFLRLALCNLACRWCDTRYTWDWEQYDFREQVIEIPLEEIERQVLSYDCKYLVVTGGEPMIQQESLVPLLEYLKNRGFYVEIETNGTLMPEENIVSLVNHWSISPKLSNSGNKISTSEIPQCYQFFRGLPNSHFKFVIGNEGDFDGVLGIVQKYLIPLEMVILMPEARDRKTLIEKSVWLVELCKREGYMFSTRLQVLLWGDRRGA